MSLLALLVVMFCFQSEYMSKHITKKGLIASREKRNLFIVTGAFSISILYRALFNIIKLIWGTLIESKSGSGDQFNDIDWLES